MFFIYTSAKWRAEQKSKEASVLIRNTCSSLIYIQSGSLCCSMLAFVQSWWLNVCIYRIMFLFSVSLRWYLTSHGVYSEWIKMCPVGDICWQVTVLCFLFEYKRRSFLSPRSHRLSVEPVKWPWLYLLQHASDPCLWPYASYCRGGGGPQTSHLTPHVLVIVSFVTNGRHNLP